MNNLSILPNDNIAEDPPAATPPPPAPAPPPPQRPQYSKQTYSNVKVIDLEMSFGNMVVFMIKWAFATIPAALLIMAIGVMIFGGLAALGIGLGSLGK